MTGASGVFRQVRCRPCPGRRADCATKQKPCRRLDKHLAHLGPRCDSRHPSRTPFASSRTAWLCPERWVGSRSVQLWSRQQARFWIWLFWSNLPFRDCIDGAASPSRTARLPRKTPTGKRHHPGQQLGILGGPGLAFHTQEHSTGASTTRICYFQRDSLAEAFWGLVI